MGSVAEIKVPDIGDFDEVDVVEVLVSAGDRVEVDAPLITLESDKASMEVPSTVAGVIEEVKVKVGDQVGEGAVIVTVKTEKEEDDPDEAAADEDQKAAAADEEETREREKKDEEREKERAPAEREERPAEEKPRDEESEAEPAADSDEGEGRAGPPPPFERRPPPTESFADDVAEGTLPHASPSVRRYARLLGVDLREVSGSGPKDRILREDVERFVEQTMEERRVDAGGARAAAGGSVLPELPEVDFSKFGPIETRPLGRIRRLAARNVHRSWLHVPHVTQHDQADITEMEAFRKAEAPRAEQRGFKLTPLVFIMKAVVAGLEELPDFNSSLHRDGEHLILKKYFHLGIAVDTPAGLVVPVIRDVDKKGLFELAEELAEVSSRAREGKMKLSELQGACFSISSLGGIGGTAFTPIVSAPEVAILGVSRAQWRPVYRDGELEPRLMLPLSLSYDHRVIDGAAAVRFTTYLSRALGDVRRLLL